MPQSTAAQMLGMPASTVSDILHRLIKRVRKDHRIRDLKRIGIDEISYAKGHRYATLVYDLDRSCVVWVGRGQRPRDPRSVLHRGLTKKPRSSGPAATMSDAYIGGY